MTELRGITWNHSRGYAPMAATAQRFGELHPDISIAWDKRSLQQFADWPIERLAETYDLLVIDHPCTGFAAAHDLLIALDDHLPDAFRADQAANSTGASFASYRWGERQWALAIDAAAPVCGFRPDLLEAAGAGVPQTWSELLELARRGLVAVPALAIDSLMHWYMLCIALGEEPFRGRFGVVSEQVGARALTMLRELVSLCEPECLRRNPIATWEALAAGSSAAVCPFAYGYSNYARAGYAERTLQFGNLVRLDNGNRCRSVLGGAGLAVSSRSAHSREAVLYCEYVAGARCQGTLYFDSGGQPGHRCAWLDAEVNRRCGNFFLDTLDTLDQAWLRPRFNGYLDFQDRAGTVVHEYLENGGDAAASVRELNRSCLESIAKGTTYETA